MAGYNLNPQISYDSFIARLRVLYPNRPLLEEGLIDSDDSVIETYSSGAVKPFMVTWARNPTKTGNGKSFAGTRLDQRKGGMDVVIVARSGKEARDVANDVYDKIIGFKPTGSGRVTDADRGLWSDARGLDMGNRPTRWAVSLSFEWGLYHDKV